MIETLTNSLPPEQKARLHADFLANEQDYLRLRESLLATHRGLWVAVHEGKVIAEGSNFMTVMASLADCGFHPFIAQVGAEDEEAFRIRRQEFTYDQTYRPNPMPRIEIVFWNQAETLSRHFFDAIPDTGADITVLPEDDCKALGLASSLYSTTKTRGYMGSSVRTVIYLAKAEIDGRRTLAFVQPVAGSREKIIGRDVLNEHRVTFDGPAGLVIFGG